MLEFDGGKPPKAIKIEAHGRHVLLIFFCISSYLLFLNICRFLVRVSYLEIYNEEVRDLLGKDQTQRLEV